MDKKRTFQQIAKDIKSTWLNVYFGAVPYLEAMLTLNTSDPNAMYFYDTASRFVFQAVRTPVRFPDCGQWFL